jgi:predicted RNase H-like HicB family nuclease
MTVMERSATVFARSSNHPVGGSCLVRGAIYSETSGLLKKFDQDWGMVPRLDQVAVEATTTAFSVIVRSFSAACGTVAFTKPLQVHGVVSEGDYELEVPDLGILEFGESYSECLKNFMDALAFRWEQYGLERDDRMSPRALEQARNFRSLVVS